MCPIKFLPHDVIGFVAILNGILSSILSSTICCFVCMKATDCYIVFLNLLILQNSPLAYNNV